MKQVYRLFTLAVLFSAMSSLSALAQTTVFTDDFNRTSVSPGGTPSATYTNAPGIATYSGSQIAGTDAWSNVAFAAGQLAQWVDGSGSSATVNSYSQTSAPLSSYASLYNATLSSNTGLVSWTFNMRTSTGATGFGTTQNNAVVVLAGSNASFNNAGTGYAVTFNPASNKAIELVTYASGISGTVTPLITSSVLLTNATDYASVRITYDPATNTWNLYVRDDGTAAFADPSTGVTTSGGSVVNSVYTSVAMSVFGFYSHFSSTSTPTTGNTSYAYYDNYSVSVNCGLAPITGAATVCPGNTATLANATTGGTWSSGNTGVATVGASGVVSGVAAGTATITYSVAGGCYNTRIATVNPNPAPITGSLMVCVASVTSLTNISAGGTWSTAPTAIATVTPASGVVAGISNGVATVSYTLPTGCYATNTIIVNPLPAAITGTPVVCANASTTLADATSGGTWSSASTSVATIGNTTGIMTGIAAGTTVISYTLPTTCYVTAVATVNPLPVPVSGSNYVCIGLTTALTDATGGGTWSSSAPSKATIGTSTGIVSGVAAGISTITYKLTATGCYTTFNMNVSTPPTSITGSVDSVCVGSSIVLNDGVPGGTWASNDPTIAAVGASTGIVTGVHTGITTISYTTIACNPAFYTVTVNPIPSPITGFPHVCVGSSTTLVDTTALGIWSSSSPGIASVSSSGVVAGLAYGTATITYKITSTGCYRAVNVVSDSLPHVIAGIDSVCPGSTVTLTNSAPGGVWSSSNASLASVVDTSGVVTGVTSGDVYISYTLLTGCYKQVPFHIITPVVASVALTDTPLASPLCADSIVTFTAHPSNGGTPTYVWEKMGTVIPGATGATYAYVPSNGDVIKVIMTAGNICATPVVSGDELTMTVYPSASPSIYISTPFNILTTTPVNTCNPVTGIAVTKSITRDTVQLSWNAVSGSVGYEWVRSASPYIATAGTFSAGNSVMMTTTGFADSLQPHYYLVRNHCSTTSFSDWASDPIIVGYWGQNVTLNSDVTYGGTGLTYQWYRNGVAIAGATGSAYSQDIYGNDTFYCVITSNAPCIGFTTVVSNSIVIMASQLSVNALTQAGGSFSLFPNPSNGSFTLSGDAATGNAIGLEVTDMLGRGVYTGEVVPVNGKVNELIHLDGSLPAGAYLLRLSSVGGSQVFHFVINR